MTAEIIKELTMIHKQVILQVKGAQLGKVNSSTEIPENHANEHPREQTLT